MTELRDVANGNINHSELIPKVTKAIGGELAGKFIVGLFYERKGLLFCYIAPESHRSGSWSDKPQEAIEKWQALMPTDTRQVINPFLVQENER